MGSKDKFFDILPPGEIKKEKGRTNFPRKTMKRPRSRIIYGFFLVTILIIIFVSSSFYFSQATIEIFPKTETISDKINLLIDENAKEISLDSKTIPGEFLNIQNVISQEFASTGKDKEEGKAKGKIRVFNNYSTSSIPFRAGTRFMSASGKIFISPKRIVVPGKKVVNGKWMPGTLDVNVEAIEPGEDYNIEPTTFSIPGLSGTVLYTSFYAKSFDKMTGGFKEEVSQVTKEDIEKAKELLTKKLKEEEKKTLLEKAKSDSLYLFQDTLSQKITNSFCPIKAGAHISSFNYEVEMKSSIFSFKKNDLDNFIFGYVRNRIPDDKEINGSNLRVDWEMDKIDEEKGEALINVSFSVPVYSKINESELRKYTGGKSKSEARSLLENQPSISKVNIRVFPSFINRVPKRLERIKIELKLD